MPPAPTPEVGELIVIGGGCYGTQHASRLAQGKDAGKLKAGRIRLVDRDPHCQARQSPVAQRPDVAFDLAEYDAFLDAYLGAGDGPARPEDHLIPAPLAPHILAAWLFRAFLQRSGRQADWVPVAAHFGQPFERQGGDGAHYLSFADWLCPVNCIEPARCPAIKGPRAWDQATAIQAEAQAQGVAVCAVFTVRHLAWGVASTPVAQLLAALAALLAQAEGDAGPWRAWVGTASHCHAALAELAVAATHP